jgi:hypothetical protein
MNARVVIAHVSSVVLAAAGIAVPVPDIGTPALNAPMPLLDVFRLRCEARAILVESLLMDFHEAVDGLQCAAIRYGLTKQIGTSAVQAIMADAFRSVPR